ncbi:hypothetical protein J4419_02975 [Candidatus Woesearchaeota archaeon]|nr:hypothetical protein [Candidatus Woesearchaeota archaeon]
MHLIEPLAEAFTLAGFSCAWNVARGGFTVELLASKNLEGEYEDFLVACGCAPAKDIRGLLERMIKAKKELNVQAIVLLVEDGDIGEDRLIAQRHNILIWEKRNLDYYLADLRKDPQTGTRKLMAALGHGAFIHIHKPAGEFNAPQDR